MRWVGYREHGDHIEVIVDYTDGLNPKLKGKEGLIKKFFATDPNLDSMRNDGVRFGKLPVSNGRWVKQGEEYVPFEPPAIREARLAAEQRKAGREAVLSKLKAGAMPSPEELVVMFE